jgi:DNA-binding CsgD family transcriptional regulator/tetratricopeptide (TPR) repeat protein
VSHVGSLGFEIVDASYQERQTDAVVQVLCPVVVGREGALAVLGTQLDAALGGRGTWIALSGEAGIGKSRLAREAVAVATDRGAPAVVGRATPAGAAGAYRPLTEALLQALRHHPVLDEEGLGPWLALLAGLVPQVVVPAPAADPSPAARGEAVLQLLARLAEPDGLVVVLEDLHWADADTLAVVDYLADNLAGQRVLLLVTVRNEEPSPALDLLRRSRGRAGAVHLELGRLEAEDVAVMVRTCVPDAPDALVERVRINADGVPLLVEELLASPGVPTSLADTVRQRLATFDDASRAVVDAAAVLGRRFDWQLLEPMTGLSATTVTGALGTAVERLLVRVEDGEFRFRHALTREAVLGELLPPRRRALASAGLAAIRSAHPDLQGEWRELGADLASRAGDPQEAAALLTAIGRDALARGALATAIDTLDRALTCRPPGDADTGALLSLVEAYAMAGRVDEAVSTTRAALSDDAASRLEADARLQLQLLCARAAVAADRWEAAAEHLAAARATPPGDPEPELAASMAVLDAEVALAAGDMTAARAQADSALSQAGSPETRCHALEVLGRIDRITDLASAHGHFEAALGVAERADLAIWRMRALHELGTVEMFDHAGTDSLLRARRLAGELGALSTAAVIELQLSAVGITVWDPEAARQHAAAALDLAHALGLELVREKALLFLAEAAGLRSDADLCESYLQRVGISAPADSTWEGFAWGFRGEVALTTGDVTLALEHLRRATEILARFPYAEPAAFRTMWCLLLASAGDARAGGAVEQARRLGIANYKLNAGLLGYADAVLAGRGGDGTAAASLAVEADRALATTPTWRALARVLAARSAADGGWGDPTRWLAEGADVFTAKDLPGLVAFCRRQVGAPGPDRWGAAGLTQRETDVLALVAEGLANKEIAGRLGVSARTVEKHVEALLRKTAARSRTQLAVWAREAPATT